MRSNTAVGQCISRPDSCRTMQQLVFISIRAQQGPPALSSCVLQATACRYTNWHVKILEMCCLLAVITLACVTANSSAAAAAAGL
jgi:hypothetical protein